MRDKKVVKADKLGHPSVDKRVLPFTVVPREYLERFNREERVKIPEGAEVYVVLNSETDDNFIRITYQFYRL